MKQTQKFSIGPAEIRIGPLLPRWKRWLNKLGFKFKPNKLRSLGPVKYVDVEVTSEPKKK